MLLGCKLTGGIRGWSGSARKILANTSMRPQPQLRLAISTWRTTQLCVRAYGLIQGMNTHKLGLIRGELNPASPLLIGVGGLADSPFMQDELLVLCVMVKERDALASCPSDVLPVTHGGTKIFSLRCTTLRFRRRDRIIGRTSTQRLHTKA